MIGNKLKSFLIFLKKQEQLPGIDSQLKFSPRMDGVPFRNFNPTPKARKSAVMILLLDSPTRAGFDIVLTLRSSQLKSHRGQISFPGGRLDADETPWQAAIREAGEEIGVFDEHIDFVAELSPIFVPPSNSLIYSFVSHLKTKEFVLNPDEVEELFYVNMDFLADDSNIIYENRLFDGTEILVPCWQVDKKEKLWGATAMILSELISLYKQFELEESINSIVFHKK